MSEEPHFAAGPSAVLKTAVAPGLFHFVGTVSSFWKVVGVLPPEDKLVLSFLTCRMLTNRHPSGTC